jgi:hypothetical protein
MFMMMLRRKKLKPLLKVVSAGRQSGKVPFTPTDEQMSCCHGAGLILQTYFATLFANFRTYCLCDKCVPPSLSVSHCTQDAHDVVIAISLTGRTRRSR